MLEIKIILFFVVINSLKSQVKTIETSKFVDQNLDNDKSSLVFVFDTTGSMYNDLEQLREGAEMIMDAALEKGDIIEDFVFVPFHDPAVGPPTVTKDKQVFKTALDRVNVYGGGDCPEKSLTGIQMALNVSRPRSFVYVFTDATAADYASVGAVLDSVQRKQSQVVFVLTGHCNDLHRPSYKVYQQISAASAGQVFNLNKTSVHNVLDFVRSSVQGRTVNLGSAVMPAGYNHSQAIPVDNSLGEVTVSVSGANPSIQVVDPRGHELTGPPKLVTMLDLAEIMVVKVLQPEAGNWTVTTGSAQEHSVRVVGRSDLTFTHGFSVQRPSSLFETTYRPLQSAYNHMLISVPKIRRPARIDFAEIIALDGRTLFEVPLHAIDEAKSLYEADAFVPPDDLFYIGINGHDEFNQELRRIGATAIQSKPPDAPYLTAPLKIEAKVHDKVSLRCHIESLVPVTAMWTKDNAKIQPMVSSVQTTTIEYVVEDMSEAHVGTYRCVARNVAGVSTAATEVILLVGPPIVKISPQNKTLQLGENVTITCSVATEALLLNYRLYFNGTRHNFAIDINLEPNIEGVYVFNKTIRNVQENDGGMFSCVARNRGGESKQSTHITIQRAPVVQILGPHTLTKLKHSNLQLVCHVENAQKVWWMSPNGTVVKEVEVEGSVNDMLDLYGLEDNGAWTCVATRNTYRVIDSVEITLLIKPEVSISGPKNITVLNGTTYDVTCLVTALPAPRIIWHRETERFLNHTVSMLQPNVYKSVLVLDSSREPINGTYFCFGENSEGIGQDSINVKVRRSMRIVEGFSDISVQLYSAVTLHCNIDSYPQPNITWYHNRTQIVTTHNIYITKDYSLNMVRVDFKNLGQYLCLADNGYEKLEVRGTLSVVALEAPVIIRESRTVLALIGTSVVLPCRVLKSNPAANITWQFKNTANFTNLPKDVRIVEHSTNNLIIAVDKVSVNHEGIYRCVAENVFGKDEMEVFVTVYLPPEINSTGIKQEVEAIEGQTINLACRAVGIPAPETTWLQNGRNITDERKVADVNGLRFTANLTDFGDYTCVARNRFGNATFTYSVFVWVPPTIKPPLQASESVVSGKNAYLQCDAIGFPVPTIWWEIQGVLITENTTEFSYNEVGNLYINNANDEHEGTYSCVAENVAGVAKKTIYLHVNEPPTILPDEYSGRYVATNRDAVLLVTCLAKGKPQPLISWSKGEQLLDKDPRYNISPEGTLSIHSPTEDLSGLYTCIAKNPFGVANKTIVVDIYSVPMRVQADGWVTALTVQEGTDVNVECPVRNLPTDVVKWYKDAVQTATGHLQIRNVSRTNASTYACVVSNAVASTHAILRLDVDWPPRFVANFTEKVEVVRGNDAYLDCEVDAKPIAKTKWYFNARPLLTADHQKLKLIDAQLKHSGSYKCYVSNDRGSVNRQFLVDVLEPPFISHADILDVQLLQGANATLECNARGSLKPQITWTHENMTWNLQDLTLHNVSSHSEGVYRCDAINKAGRAHLVYRLSVVASARVDEVVLFTGQSGGVTVDKTAEVQLNSRVRLSCKSSGRPSPTIRWIHNGISLSQNVLNVSYADLTLDRVKSMEGGLYSCVAWNDGGADERRIRLDVLEPPAIYHALLQPATKQPLKLEVLSEQPFSLHCHPRGYPTPVVYWFRDGVALRLYDDSMVFSDYGEVIDVDRARLDQSGNYTCVARNKVGAASFVYLVDVIVPPPTPKETFKTVKVLNGKSLYLTCLVEGSPLPEVTWIKRPYAEINGTTPRVAVMDNILIINNTLVQDSGNYSCIMTNKAGTTEVSFDVMILKPPSIAGNVGNNVSEHHVVPLLRSVVLDCRGDGNPSPRVTWLKDTQPLSANSSLVHHSVGKSVLAIRRASVSDAGQYVCLLDNDAGTAHRRYNVAVKVPGKWSSWSQWSYCNATCGLGYQQRSRICQYIDDNNEIYEKSTQSDKILVDTSTCEGSGIDLRQCHMPSCDDQQWGPWTQWGACTTTCGRGTQARSRKCIGEGCQGDNVQIRQCVDLPKCPQSTDDNEVFNENSYDSSAFLPEATYLMRPEVVIPQYKYDKDAEEAYLESETYEVNVTFNLDGSERGPCDAGYAFNNKTEQCEDIEECLIDKNMCHSTQICINTAGGYNCACPKGYSALGIGQRCMDVNECVQETSGCEYACVNVAGGYACACPRHLRLHRDRHRCVTPNHEEPLSEKENEAYLNTAIDYLLRYKSRLK